MKTHARPPANDTDIIKLANGNKRGNRVLDERALALKTPACRMGASH